MNRYHYILFLFLFTVAAGWAALASSPLMSVFAQLTTAFSVK